MDSVFTKIIDYNDNIADFVVYICNKNGLLLQHFRQQTFHYNRLLSMEFRCGKQIFLGQKTNHIKSALANAL